MTGKPQCAVCGSRRQRNLKFDSDTGRYVCIRCMLGHKPAEGTPRAYRMSKRDRKEVTRYRRQG